MVMLRRDSIVDTLRRIDWARLGARWVVVFGSLASKGVGRDVDLLVRPAGKGGAEWRLRMSVEIGEVIGVDWARVDIVEANTDTPCPIVYDAWRQGVVVYEERGGLAREWLLVRVMVCSDYGLAVKRLEVVKTAVRAARRRWDSGSPS